MNAPAPEGALPRESHRRKTTLPAVEAPTLLLILLAYGAWVAVTLAYGHWPLWVVAPAVAVVLTLHSSLQHEILHGHPTRWRSVNRLLGIVPLSLWLPYDRYRHTHLVHHADERLTDPIDDPETFYWTPEDYARMNPVSRALYHSQQTLAGRVLIGSSWRIAKFLRSDARAILRGDQGVLRAWLEHLLWCLPVVLWVTVVCHIPFWIYVVAMIIPGNALLLVRSFAEHRARPGARERIAIVERSWILGPLFLFNNLHSLHHEEPGTPWYELNARYQVTRERLIVENGGLLYSTYFDVVRRFLFRSHDELTHPSGRVPRHRAH